MAQLNAVLVGAVADLVKNLAKQMCVDKGIMSDPTYELYPNKLAVKVEADGKYIGDISYLDVQKQYDKVWASPPKQSSYYKYFSTGFSGFKTIKQPKPKATCIGDLYKVPYTCGRKAKKAEAEAAKIAEKDAEVDKLITVPPTGPYMYVKSCGCKWTAVKVAECTKPMAFYDETADLKANVTFEYKWQWQPQLCYKHVVTYGSSTVLTSTSPDQGYYFLTNKSTLEKYKALLEPVPTSPTPAELEHIDADLKHKDMLQTYNGMMQDFMVAASIELEHKK